MEWIKCGERMPKGYDPVLVVYGECDGNKMVYTFIFDDEDDRYLHWIMFGYVNRETKQINLIDITHWMPLPTAPK